MLGTELLAVFYGLGSAFTWGAGDFSGGFASKRGNVLSVIVISQLVGLGFLLLLSLIFPENTPSFHSLAWGAAGGVFGATGLVALYTALASGRMSIVAPLSAVMTALVPIGFSFFLEGLPRSIQLVGMVIALASVWILSARKNGSALVKKELVLSLAAGVGFGLFFVCIDQASETAIIRPLIAARVASVSLFGCIVLKRGSISNVQKIQIPYIVLAGVLDASGNALFAMAASLGRLDISSVLASLYPASTVLLAGLFLKERLQFQQWIGVVTAVLALILIAF
ncbi:MAG: DMT family transporter [Proteobacteria bacterium]|nr:DMT family transporter [Pseudomonadota bacterium]